MDSRETNSSARDTPVKFTEVSAERTSRRWIGALFLVTLGMWTALLGAAQVLLPARLEVLDPKHKVWDLGLVTALGAVAAVISSPVAGRLSDRTAARFGRRRPWVAATATLCACALFALPLQASVAGIGVCWILMHGGVNAMHAALCAAVPDRVPVRRRGTVSAVAGFAMPLGLVFGTLLASGVPTWAGFLLSGGVIMLLAVPFLLFPEPPAAPRDRPPRARSAREFVAGLWVSPREHPDFAWAWGGRFFAQLASSLATLYLFYFLRDEIRVADPAGGVAILSILYTLGVVAASVVAGRLSDRSGRRKAFVVVSSGLMAAALIMMAFLPHWPVALVAAVILGAGYGVYLAIDQALVTQVLPRAGDHAKDLGLINMAGSGAVALAPLIAALTLTAGDFAGLFTLAAGLALVGGLCVQPIRSVH